jgi:hypothetical protein
MCLAFTPFPAPLPTVGSATGAAVLPVSGGIEA